MVTYNLLADCSTEALFSNCPFSQVTDLYYANGQLTFLLLLHGLLFLRGKSC